VGRKRKRVRIEEVREEKELKKEDPGARKGRKVVKRCALLMLCGLRGSKSRLAKAAGAEASGRMMQYERWTNCTLLWREAHFKVKMLKAPQHRITIGICDVEKVD